MTGVNSALRRDEFVLYLVGADLISNENAQALLDQAHILARLDTVRPLLVDSGADPASARLRAVLPTVARYLESHYRPVRQIGAYTVSRWQMATADTNAPPPPL